MKRLLTLSTLILSLLLAQAAAGKYDVTCPKCEVAQILTPQKANGGEGASDLDRPKCKTKFGAPIKPDKFVPKRVATKVEPSQK